MTALCHGGGAERIRLVLPVRGVLRTTHEWDDPLRYYYYPLLGRMFRHRMEMGLALLSPPYGHVLEVGYGSGLLLPTLGSISKRLTAVDRGTAPGDVHDRLAGLGVRARLVQADLVNWDGEGERFDLVVAFSVLEHIVDVNGALASLARLTAGGATLLVGMPRVDRFMGVLFAMIGYPRIAHHHVTTVTSVIRGAERWFTLEDCRHYPSWVCASCGLYFALRFRRRAVGE